MKYNVPNNESEILPNLLGLTTAGEIGLSEFEGFLKAEIFFTEKLSPRTRFSVTYIKRLHKTALQHLYGFAGKYRDVNMSKAGFPFPAAKFLVENMDEFQIEVLSKLPNRYDRKEDLIRDIAVVHAELLFIHPFREGNGRTARILANLMCRKQGYKALKFELITDKLFPLYILAVQQAAKKDYAKMIGIIETIFPG
jgi:cell filamentation protein